MNRVLENLPAAPAVAKHSGARILVVDDEPLVRKFIETSLRGGGYEELISSNSGNAVPQIAVTERPALIIMDVMMPGGNGLRALRILRQNPHTERIPVILTSGFNVLTIGECAQNQADHLLPKPFTPAQLLSVVERLLSSRRDGTRARASTATQPVATRPAATA